MPKSMRGNMFCSAVEKLDSVYAKLVYPWFCPDENPPALHLLILAVEDARRTAFCTVEGLIRFLYNEYLAQHPVMPYHL